MTTPAPSSRWGGRAACAGRTSPDPTFPDLHGAYRRVLAYEYCKGCPVMAQCAADAVEQRDEGIVRGGVFIPLHNNSTMYRAARRSLRYVADGFVPLSGDAGAFRE